MNRKGKQQQQKKTKQNFYDKSLGLIEMEKVHFYAFSLAH